MINPFGNDFDTRDAAMHIRKFAITNYAPIAKFETDELGDIVIISGANGSGKTRLKQAIIQTFQNPNGPQLNIDVDSTRPNKEAAIWGSQTLSMTKGVANPQFAEYMKTRSRGGTYTGSVIQIDSNRSVQPIQFESITLATPDPDDVDIEHTFFLSPFINRWQSIVNKIFQKVANVDNKIAAYVKANLTKTGKEVLANFPNPFEPYQKIFTKLLPDKTLDDIDPKNLREFHYRVGDSGPLAFSTLSAGEQEVVKIAFDLMWKQIRHCVIFLDEPELHLHPTLTFRLIETIKEIGDNTNQFFFFTHSADLISTYYSTGDVYFIDMDVSSGNQARRLINLDGEHQATARAMGNNLGLFAVGKKLVFVEGEDVSIDRVTYHKVSQRVFPEAYVLPIGSVENITALNRLSKELQASIFGIDFFMIRDRDGLRADQIAKIEENPRFRCLRRRHVENYFLDAEVLAAVARKLYLDDQWQDADKVQERLLEIAKELLPYAVTLHMKQVITVNGTVRAPQITNVGSKELSEVKQEFVSSVSGSLSGLSSSLSASEIDKEFENEETRLTKSLTGKSWKALFPGKLIFGKICGDFGVSTNRIRRAYLDTALRDKPEVFSELTKVFEAFKAID